MNVITTWRIAGLNLAPTQFDLDNVVTKASWILGATDGQNTLEWEGVTALPEPHGNFTPYDQLTELQVLQWVKNAMGSVMVAGYESGITDKLQGLSNVETNTMPWGN